MIQAKQRLPTKDLALDHPVAKRPSLQQEDPTGLLRPLRLRTHQGLAIDVNARALVEEAREPLDA